MTLKPLGLKDTLIRSNSLGNNFKPLRSPPPLSQSRTPLGQSLQPLGDSAIQPLLEVNEDWETGNWQLDTETQVGEDGGNFAGRISNFYDEQLPIRSRTEINSKAGETPTPQELFGNSGNYPSENDSLSPNAAALDSTNDVTNNIAQLKPLGISKPLVQASAFEISSLSDLPQFIQKKSTSSSENLVSTSGETSSLYNSTPTDTIDRYTNVSPRISATSVNSMSESESLDLPQISRFSDRSLGFNKELSSSFTTEPLPQPQTKFSEKLNLEAGNLPFSSATNRGEVEAIAPTSPNLIQTKTSPVPTQETVSSSSETIQEQPQNLMATSEPELEAIAPTSPNLIQTKTSELSSQETESLTATPEAKLEAIAPTSPNLIQAKTSELSSQETESLTATPEAKLEAIAPTSPNLIQAKTSELSSQEIILPQSETSQPNIIQNRLDNPSLNLLKPLGNSKPLGQNSDLFISDFVADVAEKQPTISPETSPSSGSSSLNISNLPEEDLLNISRKNDTEFPKNSAKVENLPNSWSSISELLGESNNDVTANIDDLKPLGFARSLNNTNNLILPKLEDKSKNNNERQNNIGFDTPTSWSNISELLGESSTTRSESIQTKQEVPPASLIEQESSSPSYTISSPNLSENSTSITSAKTSQEITAGTAKKDISIDDEQLEKLAQKVYTLMRQWLEIEQERQGNQCLGYPIWLSNITSIYGTSAKVKSAPKQSNPEQRTAEAPGEVSPADDKLQKLTREIYNLIRLRLQIERERQGGYYTKRIY